MSEALGAVKQMATTAVEARALAEPRENKPEEKGVEALAEVARRTHLTNEQQAARLFISQGPTYIEDEGGMQRATVEEPVLDFAGMAQFLPMVPHPKRGYYLGFYAMSLRHPGLTF